MELLNNLASGFAVARRNVESDEPRDTVVQQVPEGGSLGMPVDTLQL